MNELATDIALAMAAPRITPGHGEVSSHGPHHAVYCARCERWVDVVRYTPDYAFNTHIRNVHREVPA